MEKQSRKKRKRSAGFTVGKNDPLFKIFERHLYEFNYETRENFITTVVREYIQFLAQDRKVVIPTSRRGSVETAIAEDVSDMLVRKIYGCLQVEDDGAGQEKDSKYAERLKEAVAAENAVAVVSPQEMKKRLSKLVR